MTTSEQNLLPDDYQKQVIDVIRKIYNHLLLNLVYITNPGLYYGKTGCLLFFAHYAGLYPDDVNNEIVLEIIDDIFEKVDSNYELNIPNGVCGIGWGVEYILQNQLMEGDSDEILADLDKMILAHGIEALSSHTDFADILRFITIRLTSSCGESNNIPFPREYLLELYHSANNPAKITDFAMRNDINIIKKILEKGRFRLKPLGISYKMTGKASIDKFPLIPLGLYNGLSGLGINFILENRINIQ